MFDVNKIKKDFPILQRQIHGKPLVYLDNAATTQKPKQVIEALVNYYQYHNANIHRGIHTLAEEATQMYEEVRTKVVNLIKAKSPREIIFVRNATEAINLAAYSWGYHNINKDDVVVTTIMEHHSNFIPWQQLCLKKGARLVVLNTDLNFKSKIKSAKLLAITHVSNVLGIINPIKEIIEQVKRINPNCLVLVDGAQAVPRMPVDVSDLGCDFYAFSAHKMLGPTGVGVLYAREEILSTMPPFLYGGDMIKEVSLTDSKWNNLPHKFEAGTPNIADVIAFGSAIDYLQKVGLEKIYLHEKKLTEYALNQFAAIPQITVYGLSNQTGVISFNLEGIHPHDVAQILDYEGIAIRSGFHCAMPLHKKLNIEASCRISFYIYNTIGDIDKLTSVLKKIINKFSKYG